MKRLLKYLLPVIMAAAFWNYADADASQGPEVPAADCSVDKAAHDASFSSAENEVFLPRPTNFTCAQRVQNAVRRTNSAHRSNFEFAKSGKVINADLRYFSQRKFLINHSTQIEPSYRLFSLCKLII